MKEKNDGLAICKSGDNTQARDLARRGHGLFIPRFIAVRRELLRCEGGMGKAPAFQLFAQDFDMDTADWDNEEVGMYIRLLICQWANGPLPNDLDRLARIVRTSRTKFIKKWSENIQKKFIENGQKKLINLRLEKTREKQLNYQESQSKAGKKGIEKKRQMGMFPFSDPSTDPSTQKQTVLSSSSTSTSKPNNKDKPLARKEHAHLPGLQIWFDTYQRIKGEEYSVSNWGEDTKHIKWMLGQVEGNEDKLRAVFEAYLDSGDKLAMESGWSVRNLRRCFNGYKLKAGGKNGPYVDKDRYRRAQLPVKRGSQ